VNDLIGSSIIPPFSDALITSRAKPDFGSMPTNRLLFLPRLQLNHFDRRSVPYSGQLMGSPSASVVEEFEPLETRSTFPVLGDKRHTQCQFSACSSSFSLC